MSMIVFYKKLDRTILSYVSYNERKYDEKGNDIGLLKPSLQKCAQNHGLKEDDIGVKEFIKKDPKREDFKDNINNMFFDTLRDIS